MPILGDISPVARAAGPDGRLLGRLGAFTAVYRTGDL